MNVDWDSRVTVHRQPVRREVVLKESEKEKPEVRQPEWYIILMGFTGALVGYLTALALKFVGRCCRTCARLCLLTLILLTLNLPNRYVFYFVAAETTTLLALTATGAITRQTAVEIAKYTMPPFVWVLRTTKELVRGEFSRVLSASSLALRFFFVVSFGLALRYAGKGPKWPF